MNSIYDIMFSLLRSEFGWGNVKKEEIEKLDNKDFEELLRISKSNDVAHLIADSLAKLKIKNELFGRFSGDQFAAFYQVTRIEHETECIKAFFENNDFDFLMLKGAVIRKFYPKPWMRTSCDIDVLIKRQDSENIKNLLINEHSYKFYSESTHDISLISPSGIHVELHFLLIQDNELPIVAKKYANVWDYAVLCEDSKNEYEFSPEYFVFYHIVHAAKHFVNGGCGIRPFLDMKMIVENVNYDNEILFSYLEQSKLLLFYDSFIKLSNAWFDGAEHNKITRKMQDYLIPAGSYGSSENYILVNKSRGKCNTLLGKIFIPKRYLECHYPKLKKNPVLLPYYEVKRWCKIFNKSKRKSAFSFVKLNNSVSDEKIIETKNLINDLGLNR